MASQIDTEITTTTKRAEALTHMLLNLRRAQNKNEAAFLQSLGALTLPQLIVINAIGDLQPCTMTQVATQACLSLSSITLIVDKLLTMQLVVRERSDTDRRVVYARLTTDGNKIYLAQIERVRQQMHTILETLSNSEQQQFLDFFARFMQALSTT